MPTYRHPCPQCDTFIDRAAPACPACGFERPFQPDAAARAVRRPVATPPVPPLDVTAPQAAPMPPVGAGSPAGAAARCTGCGAALAAGARFCTECGTLTAG